MRVLIKQVVVVFTATAIALPGISVAVELRVPEGAIIVRIPDDKQKDKCINATTDRISLHLRRFVINKDISWFKQDKEAGLVSHTIITGKDKAEKEKKISYPRMFTTNVEQFEAGSVSIPIEQRFFHLYKLKTKEWQFTSVDLKFTIIKKKKRGKFGVALHGLAQITKKLPPPINPFSEAFQFFADYADSVVAESLNEANNVGGTTNEGTMAFAFSLDGTCSGDLETTGTKVAVKAAAGSEEDGFADIRKDYCWKAQLLPTFEVYFASKPSSGDCSSVTGYKKLRNPYYGFFLNKFTPSADAKSIGAVSREDIKAALGRCEQHGIDGASCLSVE